MLLALAFLAAPIQDADPLASPDAWMPVPVFVREELGSETWVRNDSRLYMDELVRAGFLYRHGAPVVWVEAYGGFESHAFDFRFDVSTEGEVRASVAGRHFFRSDTDPDFYSDLSGRIFVERREAGSAAPLRLEYRLFGGQPVGQGDVSPMLIEGAIELPAEAVAWNAALRSPELPAELPPRGGGRLDHVQLDWTDGRVRARGYVDELGRRQGAWSVYRANGSMVSTSTFVDGEPLGPWESFASTGTTYEAGLLVAGRRHGYWRRGMGSETTRGLMLGNLPHGTWLTHATDGRLSRIADFELGRRIEKETILWANGTPKFELTFGASGEVVSQRYWNEEGEPIPWPPGTPESEWKRYLHGPWLDD